jgi:UPF0755 protein
MEATPSPEPPRPPAPPPPPVPPAPPAPRRRRRVLLALALGLSAALVAGAAAFGWLLMGYPNRRGPGRGRVAEIALPAGASVSEVARRLTAAGALAQPRLFTLHARLRGAASRLRTGTVLVYDSMTPRELLQRVARGYGSAQLRVVIPEGFTRFEIATRLSRWGVCSRAAFLAATTDRELLRELAIEGASAEGFLFPDTYLLRDDMDARMLVRRFVHTTDKRLRALEAEQGPALAHLRSEFGWGTRELLTMASIVEKEAAVASEQAVIAGVFQNRLRDPAFKPKRLQADPTVAYGCTLLPELASCAHFDGQRVTRAMTADPDNPYNTYRLDGLPPGPIANPGLSALRAVLAPAQHGYFYFVARGGGLHAFSSSLADHNAAVEQARKPQVPSP